GAPPSPRGPQRNERMYANVRTFPDASAAHRVALSVMDRDFAQTMTTALPAGPCKSDLLAAKTHCHGCSRPDRRGLACASNGNSPTSTALSGQVRAGGAGRTARRRCTGRLWGAEHAL